MPDRRPRDAKVLTTAPSTTKASAWYYTFTKHREVVVHITDKDGDMCSVIVRVPR